MTHEPERKRCENRTAGIGDECVEGPVLRGAERAREAEHGKSSARCLEEANAEPEPEEELQHEIAIDRLSEERHRWFPPCSAQRSSSCHPTLRSAAGGPAFVPVAIAAGPPDSCYAMLECDRRARSPSK